MPREIPGDPAAEATAFDRYFRDTVEAYIGDYEFFRTEPGTVTAVDTGSRTCTATVAGVSVDGIEYPRNEPAIDSRWYITRTSKGRRWLKTIAHFILDTFSRAANPASLTICDTGQTWTAHTATWGVQDSPYGAAYIVSTTTGVPPFTQFDVATLPCGASDGVLTVHVTAAVPGTNSDAAAVVFRLSDADNFWWLNDEIEASGSELFSIWKRVAGVDTQLYSAFNDHGEIAITLAGNDITVTVDGFNVFGLVITDPFNATATRHGIGSKGQNYSSQSGTERWTYLRFDPA